MKTSTEQPGQQYVKAYAQTIKVGEHGPYIVASADGYESSITIGQDAWQEDRWPKRKTIRGTVLLVDVIWKRAGARARTARFWRDGDERLVN